MAHPGQIGTHNLSVCRGNGIGLERSAVVEVHGNHGNPSWGGAALAPDESVLVSAAPDACQEVARLEPGWLTLSTNLSESKRGSSDVLT